MCFISQEMRLDDMKATSTTYQSRRRSRICRRTRWYIYFHVQADDKYTSYSYIMPHESDNSFHAVSPVLWRSICPATFVIVIMGNPLEDECIETPFQYFFSSGLQHILFHFRSCVLLNKNEYNDFNTISCVHPQLTWPLWKKVEPT